MCGIFMCGVCVQIIPTGRFEEVVVQYGVGLPQCIVAMTSHSDCPAPDTGLSPVGEIRLMPDLSTKVILPW